MTALNGSGLNLHKLPMASPGFIQRLQQSQQAKAANMHAVAPGQQLRVPVRQPMATFFDDTDSTGCSTTAGNYIQITNSTSTTATITTTSNSTGNTIFVNSGGQWTQHNAPQQHQHPAPHVDPRVLNRYLNASDLLEEFIRDLGDLDVKQGDVLDVPIELFINWLVCKAAEEDGHEPPDNIAKLPAPADMGGPDRRCRCCGRYITEVRRDQGILFCDGEHQERWLARLTGRGVHQDRRAIERDHRDQRRDDHVQVVPRRQLVALAGVVG